ncbi:DsbA family protein [Parapedobacter soli]|uniref:DsbA family protein n=1 Tax=Parapedobacter soli TaxID=416955 RepID=UPI0021CA2C9A|nr:DsbA family protein [Parapedobacter soli]
MTINKDDSNPLMCDPVTGICEIPGAEGKGEINTQSINKPIKITYFSDPICSACWGVEPTLRKLKLEYGDAIDFEYHMGGLLPSWEALGTGVNPTVLASHSDQLSAHFQIPVNGDIWLQDPPHSSYPASIAFKAAQMQDEEKAISFLRKIREDLYVRGINIAKWKNLEKTAAAVGLDTDKLKTEYEGDAKKAFQEDLVLAQKMSVRGFPSFTLTNSEGATAQVYGMKPYGEFEHTLKQMDKGIQKQSVSTDWKSLFVRFNSMTTKEFADFSEVSFQQAEDILDGLAKGGEIDKLSTKNGQLWTKERL